MSVQDEIMKNHTGRFGRALRTFALFLAALIFSGMLYLCGAALHLFDRRAGEDSAERYAVAQESSAVERMIAGETGDIGQLREMAGFPLPFLEGQPFLGEAANAVYDGGSARLITMRYTTGIVIAAVCPAEAAPLLKRGGMELRMDTAETLQLQGLRQRVVLSESGNTSCVYFSTDDAAYAVYAQGLTGGQLIGVLNEYGLSVR